MTTVRVLKVFNGLNETASKEKQPSESLTFIDAEINRVRNLFLNYQPIPSTEAALTKEVMSFDAIPADQSTTTEVDLSKETQLQIRNVISKALSRRFCKGGTADVAQLKQFRKEVADQIEAKNILEKYYQKYSEALVKKHAYAALDCYKSYKKLSGSADAIQEALRTRSTIRFSRNKKPTLKTFGNDLVKSLNYEMRKKKEKNSEFKDSDLDTIKQDLLNDISNYESLTSDKYLKYFVCGTFTPEVLIAEATRVIAKYRPHPRKRLLENERAIVDQVAPPNPKKGTSGSFFAEQSIEKEQPGDQTLHDPRMNIKSLLN